MNYFLNLLLMKNEMKDYQLRRTKSWSYSIDKLNDQWEYDYNISKWLIINEDYEKVLWRLFYWIYIEKIKENELWWYLINSFSEKNVINDDWVNLDDIIEETNYESSIKWTFLDWNYEENKLNEVVERMKNYCENYNELRFDDDLNNQFDIDKKWMKENYPNHEILNLKYNDLDTRRKKIKHILPMNWLQKTFSLIEIERWMKKLNREFWVNEFQLWYKFDWAACTVIYDNQWKFIKSATRWNWLEWDDITKNFEWIQDFYLLNKLPWVKDLNVDQIELRWEILCSKSNFEKHKDLWIKNTRQFAAWSIKLKDYDETRKRQLVFAPYSLYFIKDWKRILIDWNKFHKQVELNQYLNSFWINFWFMNNENINFSIKLIDWEIDIKNLENLIHRLSENRDNLNVDVDWLVFKVNDYKKQIQIWEDSFMAYKFPSKNAITKVSWITFQIWTTWRVTPVVEYEPIDILWVTCSRATIHNSDYFEQYQLSIWDEISVARNWDVIPQVQEIIKRNWWRKIEMIKNCSVCWSLLERDWAFHFCKNKFCDVKQEWKIFSFINSIWLNFLWNQRIQEMIFKKILLRPFDILYIDTWDLMKLDRIWSRSVEKILNSLNKCKKEITFTNILDWFWIAWLWWINSYKISSFLWELHWNEEIWIFEFFLRNLDRLYEINWIWDSLILKIKDEFTEMSYIQEEYIERVIKDFNIKFDKEEKIEWWKLNWKSFYITWKLSKSRWDFVKEFIEKNWWVEESLKKCDYFLAWLNATSWKVDQAKELWIKIINEQEFFEMIK